MSNPIVVVDADAIIAQAHEGDANHRKALFISARLNTQQAQIVYPASAIVEATTVLHGRLDKRIVAQAIAISFTDLHVQIAQINQSTIALALPYFSPTMSKKNTFFDCIVAAVAQQYKANAIFSFDRFYAKKGFTLAEDLTRTQARA